MLSPEPIVSPPEGVRLLKSHSLTVLVQRELERMILSGEIGRASCRERVLYTV